MKIKKIIILFISIIIPITITICIGCYLYGVGGEWTKNQEKFINKVFNEDVDTTEGINNYLKYTTYAYAKNVGDIEIVNKDNTITKSTTGDYNSYNNAFKFSQYYYSTTESRLSFMLYDINTAMVTPENMMVVVVPIRDDNVVIDTSLLDLPEDVASSDEAALLNIDVAIKQIQTYWQDEDTTPSTSVAGGSSYNFSTLSLYSFANDNISVPLTVYDHGDPNYVSGDSYPLAYTVTPNKTFTFYDFKNYEAANPDSLTAINAPSSVSEITKGFYFAFVELVHNEESDERTINLWSRGKISKVFNSQDEIKNLVTAQEGYGIKANEVFKQAGYFKFVFPTLLWQCGIAFVISGALGFLFFLSWNYETTTKNPKLKKK